MMNRYPCLYLKGGVDLTAEREAHIAERHPDLLPAHRSRIAETLAQPDQVRRSQRFGSARLFSRWYADVHLGKQVVVVVMSERDPSERHWIITAYLARTVEKGEIEWKRD
jgi:hypothetical protein